MAQASGESGISSCSDGGKVNLAKFDKIDSIQDAYLYTQNLLEILRNYKANEFITRSDTVHTEKLNEKLKEIKHNTKAYMDLLEKEESLTKDFKQKIEHFCALLGQLKQFRATYQITTTDTEIQRLIYKINFMRAITVIISSMSIPERTEEVQEKLKVSRKMSMPRSIDYYRYKIETKNKMK